jgi:heme/copper-type cytochrome/quinol oxidase subunit 2
MNVILIAATVWIVLVVIGIFVLLVVIAWRNRRFNPRRYSRSASAGRPVLRK